MLVGATAGLSPLPLNNTRISYNNQFGRSFRGFVSRTYCSCNLSDRMGDLDRLPGQLMVEDFRHGYPRFCALIDAYPAWNVFRRFSKLRARIILRKQDSLSALEQQLEALDQQETTPLFLASNRLDGNTERQDVLDDIEKGLSDYGLSSPTRSSTSNIVLDDLIEAHSRILNTQSTNSRDVFSL